MPDELSLARAWFLKAESDFVTAERLVESAGPYDTACFHPQQAVEKYLKGLLALHGQACHPTHNLEELQHLGEKSVPGWPLTGMGLAELTSYAVQVRYDFEFHAVWHGRPAREGSWPRWPCHVGQTTRLPNKLSKRRARFEGVSLPPSPSKLNRDDFANLTRLLSA